jgi:hypothetical protein
LSLFFKAYFLQLSCFKVEIGSVSAKAAYSGELKNQKNLWKEFHLWYKKGLQHILVL